MYKIIVLFCLLTISLSLSKDKNVAKAQEIELLSPDGKTIKLSSLKGKMVLIDFWASWCGPCRRENPNLVEAYLEFKDKKFKKGKGFEVYSVSLDRAEDKWKEAIAADGLLWSSHVIDSKGVASQAYNVKSIPSGFLIDGKGKIVAQGSVLRGEGLKNTLKGLLK